MASTYKCITLAERPKAEIIPNQTFKIEERSVPKESELEDGQVLVENLYLSLDPAMRGWLNDARSYIPPVQIGAIMRGGCVGRVVASKSSQFKVGDLAVGTTGWAEFAVLKDKELKKAELPAGTRPSDAIGVLGLTTLTAYFGLLDIGQPKKGDLLVVSGAAGATGSMVVQIGLIKGCRVVAIAGAEDKCAWLRELGCETALNYKDKDFAQQFRAATKDLVDIYFDNVGGEILDLALSRAKPFSRFVMCGGISNYNNPNPVGPKNIMMVISMRIKMQGFIVFDFADRYHEALAEISKWLSEGKLQRKEHIIKGGLEKAPQGLVDLYKGINTGKLLVELKSETSGGARL